MTASGGDENEIASITTAAAPHSEELEARIRRYVISMTIRTLCFVGAIVTDGPIRWVLIAGAVILPYIAVIFASSGVRMHPMSAQMNSAVAAGALEGSTPTSPSPDTDVVPTRAAGNDRIW